jgi:FeS cluster assembly scaffold protein NifU
MKSTKYSEKVLDHFRNPRNTGILEGEDVAVGRVGNPVCGDLMEMYIKVENDIIKDIKFKTFGCGSAIATSSMITEMVKGKSLDEALKVTRQDVADELEGLPPIKMHCSNLAADALHDAIKNYRNKNKPTPAEDKLPEGKIEIIGEKEFENKGVYHQADDLSIFKDKRTMVQDKGERSQEIALKLTELTPRVILITRSPDLVTKPELKTRLKQSDIKILYEAEILEIRGTTDVEKVLIHDLNEDEQYELFVDAVIILR